MTDDLVQRLRAASTSWDIEAIADGLLAEAADEIERLRGNNDLLVATIERLRTWIDEWVLTGETRFDDEDGEGWQMYAGWLTRSEMPESLQWPLEDWEQEMEEGVNDDR